MKKPRKRYTIYIPSVFILIFLLIIGLTGCQSITETVQSSELLTAAVMGLVFFVVTAIIGIIGNILYAVPVAGVVFKLLSKVLIVVFWIYFIGLHGWLMALFAVILGVFMFCLRGNAQEIIILTFL